MEIQDIKELIALLKDTDVTELQIEKEGSKLKIKRDKFYGHLDITSLAHQVPQQKSALSPEPKQDTEVATTECSLITVTSPIVGTFYNSPSPDSPPFVQVGESIKKGQILCIIEAMKLMNEIESEFDGTLVKCLVENGSPVEYGEPLFLIKP